MSNTAKVARKRISFVLWMDRIEQLLHAAGVRSSQFPSVAWDRLYNDGIRPLEVAGALLDVVVAARAEQNGRWN